MKKIPHYLNSTCRELVDIISFPLQKKNENTTRKSEIHYLKLHNKSEKELEEVSP